MERFSVELLAPHLWRWVLLLIPALCLAFWAYYRILAPLRPPARWALWLLRGTAFFLVLFALWQPVATVVFSETGRPSLAILLDRSRSIALPGGGDPPAEARAAEVQAVKERLRQELEGRYRLQWFGFNETLAPLDPDSTLEPEGNTGLGQALEGVLVRGSAAPINGIVLVSDGVNTVGRDPVKIAEVSPVPVFSVAVGPRTGPTDLEIRRLQTNPTAYAGEPLPLRIVLSSRGLVGKSARIEVREGNEVRHLQELELLGDQGLEQEVMVTLRPSRPGLSLLEVSATVLGDSISENNVRQTAVQVHERKTRVLCWADALDWDFAFLKRTLDADTTLGFTYLVEDRKGQFRTLGEKRLNHPPSSAQDLSEFAAVILVSTREGSFAPATLGLLARFVHGGGGLFVLGAPDGGRTFSAAPEFARLLPASSAADPLSRERVLPVAVTAEGLRHPATALRDNPAETSRLLGSLPPIFRPASGLAVKPGAQALLEFQGRNGQRVPALVVGYADRGKVVWLHARGLWRWQLTSAGTGLPSEAYAQFLMSLTRWLAEPLIRDRFQVTPGKRVYQSGEAISLAASLWDPAYAPVSGARLAVEIHSMGDSLDAPEPTRVDLSPSAEPGRYEGEGPPLPPGVYSYRATALDPEAGTQLGAAEGKFWVETMGPEFARTWADREALGQIAQKSGGTLVEGNALDQLSEQIPRALRRVGRTREIEIWNHWALFALFLLVLSTEWFLRRRRGLA